MSILPELSGKLSEIAERRAGARRRSRRRLRMSGFTVVGVLAVGGAATATTGIWSPQVGDERRGHPTVSATSVPEAQAERFGVLRREAAPADHGEQVRYALRFLDRRFKGIRTDSVRLLHVGTPGSPVDAGQILVPTVSKDGIRDALCLFSIDPVDGGGLTCWSTAQILAGEATNGMLHEDQPEPGSAEGKARRRAILRASREAKRRGQTSVVMPPSARATTGQARVNGLVPDGVARVVWRRGRETQTIVVHDNYYGVSMAVRVNGPRPRSTIAWLDADGKVLRSGPSMF